MVCFKHPSQLGGEIPGEYSCLRAFSHYVQSNIAGYKYKVEQL